MATKDIHLARKVRETVRRLMSTHQRAVGLHSPSMTELVLVRGNRIITIHEGGDCIDLLLGVRGKNGFVCVQVDRRDTNEVQIDPQHVFSSWGSADLRKLLDDALEGYMSFVGVNRPYGYVSGNKVSVIFVRAADHPGEYRFDIFTRDGKRMPQIDLFDRSLSCGSWSGRFWRLVEAGNIVPLRSADADAWWEVGYPVPVRLDVSRVMTSNTHLLGGGTYDYNGPLIVRNF